MSTATVQVICYKSKILKDKTSPLMVRICKNGKRKYVSLGISVLPRHWDFKKNVPKRSCPCRESIDQIIEAKRKEYQQIVLDLEARNRVFTPATVVKQSRQPQRATSVGELYEQVIEEFKAKDCLGTARIHVNSRESLKRFCRGNLDFSFMEIDVEWLTRYEEWLSQFCTGTTMSMLFRTLRAVYNKAITRKIVRADYYPFREYKISHFNTKTKKRAISKEEIAKIRDLDLPADRPLMILARDLFIFSYYGAGINFTDIAYLTYSSIQDGYISYIRKKTHREITFPINVYCEEILARYGKENPDSADYVFPILDRHIHQTEQQRVNRIHKIIAKTDIYLKSIAKKVGLANLTTYVARHTYATVMKRAGVNIALISESLGHASLSTTQIYLDSFDRPQIDEAMKNLL